MRAVQRLNHRLNNEVADGGRRPRRPRAGGHAHARLAPGPLGEREAAVAWFADHVRRDLEASGVTAPGAAAGDARERILDAACDVIAEHGIDDVRIARIATLGGRLPAARPLPLRHPRGAPRPRRWSTPSSCSATSARRRPRTSGWTAAQRLGWMIDQSLPFPGQGDREWRLWLELWGRAARQPELHAVAARLYERYDAWIEEVVEEGMASGEFRRRRRARRRRSGWSPRSTASACACSCDDPAMELAHARRLVVEGWPRELGVDPGGVRSEGGS